LEVGGQLVDVLAELERVSRREGQKGWSALATLLASGAQTGAPLVGPLRRLAESERLQRRRLVELRIRRLPVLLLIPTALGVLPAFMALTIVPLLLHSAQTLS
jgi:pilus assembly protein TadC